MNFYDHKVGDEKDIEMLTQNARLNNGKVLDYASGIVNDKWKGWRQYSHGGADAGYRTFVSVFPDLKMGFIVFSNIGEFNTGQKAHEMADLFIKDTTAQKEVAKNDKRDSAAAILKDTLTMKKFVGNYISDAGLPVDFTLKNGQIHYEVFEETNFLIRDSKDTFSIPQAPQIKFVFAQKGKDTTIDLITPDVLYHLQKYKKDTSQPDEVLKKYTGTYYSPELDCRYGIALKDHHLFLTNAKYDDAKLTLIGKDDLTNDNWWMNHLLMLRDSKNNISGFEVNSGRIMHLKFNKIE
jgi:hypothetical protein